MALNKIQLPAAALHDLYKNTVLVLENQQEKAPIGATAAAPAAALRFLGQNQQKITIVVHYQSVTFLPDEDLAFMTQVLGACRLSMADVAVVNHYNGAVTATILQEQLSAMQVLLFGVGPEALDLPVVFPHFQVQAYGGATWLSAPPLAEIRADKELKTKLWNCLKVLFAA
jgi:hypothetical protein